MLNCKNVISIVALALVAAACVNAPVRFSNGVMTNNAGMTLYTYDKDVANSGKSMCNGPCATNWPPFLAKADDKAGGYWLIVTRDDGSKQWAYKGKPVYLWSKDLKPGDRTGDGVNSVWHVITEDVQVRAVDGY